MLSTDTCVRITYIGSSPSRPGIDNIWMLIIWRFLIEVVASKQWLGVDLQRSVFRCSCHATAVPGVLLYISGGFARKELLVLHGGELWTMARGYRRMAGSKRTEATQWFGQHYPSISRDEMG